MTERTRIGTQLQARLRGPVWLSDDDGYDTARTVWNGAVDHRPTAVARCLDVADVQTVVLLASRYDVPLSVRGGGHDWAGRAIREGGVVLDLSAMRGVRIDAEARVATVQGGAQAGDLLDPAGQQGLALPSGVIRDVGLAGLTMAGGYGGLIGAFGLALDNLLSAEVVLADGRMVTAGPDGDPELLWALRGGGGNFGVVTALRYRLHPLGPVLGGMIMYPYEQAGAVLRGYREVLASAGDEFTVMAGFMTGPTGAPVVYLAPTWSGTPERGPAAVEPLLRLGTPLMAEVAPIPYPDLLRMFDSGSAGGNRYALGTRWLPELTDTAIEALIEGAATISSPLSLLALHHFHGAAARISSDATAFALRQDHLLAEVIAAWPPGPPGEDSAVTAAPHLAWVDQVTTALAPGALPGGYPNILGPGDEERTKLGFGANAERLLRAKHQYDPTGIFTAIAAIAP